jgi:hypothetical protein
MARAEMLLRHGRCLMESNQKDVIFTVCKKARCDREVVRIFNCMVRKYGLKASEMNYDCVIEIQG